MSQEVFQAKCVCLFHVPLVAIELVQRTIYQKRICNRKQHGGVAAMRAWVAGGCAGHQLPLLNGNRAMAASIAIVKATGVIEEVAEVAAPVAAMPGR